MKLPFRFSFRSATVALALSLATAFFPAAASATEADRDWQAVLALDAEPRQPATSRDQAREQALAFLARQEAALRRFLANHPDDPRIVDAGLRLAHLLSMRGDFAGQPDLYDAAARLLEAMEGRVPPSRRADVAFARLSLAMRGVTHPSEKEREALFAGVRAFCQRYPDDRRRTRLLAEIATLYDNAPRQKQAILQDALKAAGSEGDRARVHDDLRRLALLGTPIDLRGSALDGATRESASLRGQVVLICFFATWSAPSAAALDEVRRLRQSFAPGDLAILGVGLDPKQETLAALKLPWPVLWDGKGWKSPLVRQFGINALPTLWVLDRKGRLRTLNALHADGGSEGVIRTLLKEK